MLALLGGLARRLGLPAPAVLVLGGLVIGLIPGVPAVRLSPNLVLLGFLPPLVYAASFRATRLDLRPSAPHILTLAVGLVVLTIAGIATAGHYLAGLPWVPAFVLGALIAPTDPVSASAVVRRVGAPQRIVAILEGESLINDGTGLAAFQVAAAAAAGGFSIGHGIFRFAVIALGGLAIGLLVGTTVSRLLRAGAGLAGEIVLGLAAAFGSYEAAQAVGCSGVLAAVAAGVLVGYRTPAAAHHRGEAFWEALSYLLESVLFLLIGLQFVLITHGLPGFWTPIGEAAAVLATAVALRFAWMFTFTRALARLGRVIPAHVEPLHRGDLVVLGFSGMRGALSLAGALSIPLLAGAHPFPARDELIFLVYAVVLGTLIVPSLTLEPLIRRVGLGHGRAGEPAPERNDQSDLGGR